MKDKKSKHPDAHNTTGWKHISPLFMEMASEPDEIDCIEQCKDTCKSMCQQTCKFSCEETCKSSCQETCETSCQVACKVSCTVGCEVGGYQPPS